MSVEVDKLFEMLNWNNEEGIQKKGIEEGLKVKHLSIFMQPIEGKQLWENCAKIIEQKTNEELKDYLFLLFEWLQDANWPGFDIIYNRVKTMPANIISEPYSYSIKQAKKMQDENWLISLGELAVNKEWYEVLNKKEQNIIKNYRKG